MHGAITGNRTQCGTGLRCKDVERGDASAGLRSARGDSAGVTHPKSAQRGDREQRQTTDRQLRSSVAKGLLVAQHTQAFVRYLHTVVARIVKGIAPAAEARARAATQRQSAAPQKTGHRAAGLPRAPVGCRAGRAGRRGGRLAGARGGLGLQTALAESNQRRRRLGWRGGMTRACDGRGTLIWLTEPRRTVAS